MTRDRALLPMAPVDPDPGSGSPLMGTPTSGPADVPPSACTIDDDGCITCGDVAVALTVIEPDEFDATCRDDHGRTELVATELVGDVVVGDRLLVHARVALEKLEVETDALR